MVSERLSQAIQALEHHPQKLRIQKLIYFISHQHWPKKQIQPDLLQLDHLVPILMDQVTTAEDLANLLAIRAAKVNKSDVYLPIADIICQILAPLCKTAPSTYPHQTTPSPLATGTTYSIFDLKAALMQSTNPLKAKILIFSVLYYPFSFNRQDWLNLKQRPLEKLLQNLFTTYPNFVALELKLLQTAEQLESLDQSQQVVHALLRVVLPHYRGQSLSMTEQSAVETFPQSEVDDLEIGDDLRSNQLFTKIS
ncbi:hypothetical protein [Acaryochloris sp. IP29b_bin.137]|uniref:hypothetical protein n=1 Tax=Acaryochloris sp. IP29b_bin.137 TaxID=2969217 RepID=UPI00261F7311|nr:hypothetical protein [Acaryochloris sp. IP29b_bin.137]